jgi:carboxyl-terminal processing protease
MNNQRKIFIYLPIILAIILVIGIWIGSKLSYISSGKTETVIFDKPDDHDKLNNIITYVLQDYVDSVSRTKLTEDAIYGILDSLDPHSQYIPAEDFHEVEDQLNSNFEGIGVQFRLEKDTIFVIRTIQGGPSEKAGVMAGDRIVKINDTVVAGVGFTSRDVVKKLKGPRGTQVKVGISRHGVKDLIDFTLVRDVIPTYSIDIAYMVNDSVGYIKLSRFAENTYTEFVEALTRLVAQGMTDLILDLRGNVGGFLTAAIKISDEFLPDQELIVYTEGHNRPNNYAYATSKGLFETQPLVILIDEGSASASEIVAGAIQDNDRGTIVGRRSFGKGLVQEQMDFPDGSALRLTVARYHTPTGRNIQRSYKGGTAEYYEELHQRYVDGEMENPDSIAFADTIKFYTPKGKVVYGGGGIMPDVYVSLKKNEKEIFYNRLVNQGILFQFAFEYTDNNRAELAKYTTPDDFIKSFKVSDQIYNELLAYARKEGVVFTPKEASDSERKVRILLKAYIGRNLLDDPAFYPVYLEIDDIFQSGLSVIEK